jgi:hypothetical protein
MPYGLAASHRASERVDLSIGAGADSFARFAEPPLFPDPWRRNSPAKSMRLIVNNNEICNRRGISRAKTAAVRGT